MRVKDGNPLNIKEFFIFSGICKLKSLNSYHLTGPFLGFGEK